MCITRVLAVLAALMCVQPAFAGENEFVGDGIVCTEPQHLKQLLELVRTKDITEALTTVNRNKGVCAHALFSYINRGIVNRLEVQDKEVLVIRITVTGIVFGEVYEPIEPVDLFILRELECA
jgi:hypothetical protein